MNKEHVVGMVFGGNAEGIAILVIAVPPLARKRRTKTQLKRKKPGKDMMERK